MAVNIAKWFQRAFITVTTPRKTLSVRRQYSVLFSVPKLTQDEPAGIGLAARFAAQIGPCQLILKQLGSIRIGD
jgi:hypothetical protein